MRKYIVIWIWFCGCLIGRGEALKSPHAETYEACLLCHSTREMQRGPLLDGLPDWYILHQLEKFRSGLRGKNLENRSESLMGTNQGILLKIKDLEGLAAFISKRLPGKTIPTVRGDPEKGKTVYLWCTGCHGEKAQGLKELKSPPLTQLEDWYMLDQLRKYKKDQRGYHEKDIFGRIMAYGVKPFSDQDFKNVVAFIKQKLKKSKSP